MTARNATMAMTAGACALSLYFVYRSNKRGERLHGAKDYKKSMDRTVNEVSASFQNATEDTRRAIHKDVQDKSTSHKKPGKVQREK